MTELHPSPLLSRILADAPFFENGSRLRVPRNIGEKAKQNRTPEENAGKTQLAACVHRVKIPPHGSAPVRREKVVRCCEAPCGVPEYRRPQPEAKANQKYYLNRLKGSGEVYKPIVYKITLD